MSTMSIRQHFQSITFPIQYWDVPSEAAGKPNSIILHNNDTLIDELAKAEKVIRKKLFIDERSWCGVAGLDNDAEQNQLGLYAAYVCFRCITWGEDIARYDPIMATYIKTAFDCDNALDACWKYVDEMISSKEVEQFCIRRNNEQARELRVFIDCVDLYAALRTQILLHIYAGEKGKNGASLAFCSNCGKPYIKEHGSKKLCNDCGSNAGRSKARRDRIKEGASNAAQSNP